MYALITVQDVPEKGSVQFLADLPPGFLGPAIGKAMQEMVGGYGLPQFTTIRKVLLHSDSSQSGETIALIEEDVVPAGFCITTPKFDVLCDWMVQAEDEFDSAFEKAGIQFGDSSVKPMVSCLAILRQASPVPVQPSQAATGAEDSEPKKTTPKRLKVYFTSANAEEYRGGDADYMKSLVEGMHLIGIDAVRLVNERLPGWGEEQQALAFQGKLRRLDYYASLSEAQQAFHKDNYDVQADATLRCMLKFLEQEIADDSDIIPILHIQSRLPGSGNAFRTAGAIEQFKAKGIRVFVTVHEWVYNSHYLKRTQYEGESKAICMAAHGAILVNDEDERAAAVENSAFIPIPITVAFESIDVEAVLQRPVRILMFGMLRPNKGFDQAADLGDTLLERYLAQYDPRKACADQTWSVYVVGKLHESFAEFEKLVKRVYKDAIYQKVFGNQQAGWVRSEYDRVKDDNVFNTNIAVLLQQCDALREASYADLLDAKAKGSIRSKETIKQERGKVSPLLQGKPSEPSTKWLRQSANRESVDVVCAELQKSSSLSELISYSSDALAKELSSTQLSRVDGHADAVRNTLFNLYKKALSGEEQRWDAQPLPVFFSLNVAEPDLLKIFRECKYVYKPDDKGMADNASAMISPMSNGCILFTKWGRLTPVEFLTTSSPRAEDLRPERYKLDLQGRYAQSVVLSQNLDNAMSPDAVLQEIFEREKDNNATNRNTLVNLKHITEHRYLPIMIAARHVIYYRKRLALDEGKIVVPQQEK